MCGIAGVISAGKITPHERWETLSQPLKFRGPDDHGDWHFSNDRTSVSFFHTRLSIIDVSPAGHQPMTSPDGNIVVVLNGEIYNYKLLREQLIAIGTEFRSGSDTEVLLHGYRHWGFDELMRRLDGMFAFALYDKLKDVAYLTRDRFGKKPLYYHFANDQLIFSSDIRSFRHAGLQLSIDLHALGYFFSEFGTPLENSIWNEVKKVKPASFIEFRSGRIVRYIQYWTLNYTEDCQLSQGEIIERTEQLLSEAVKKRLVSDVGVGSLLSGGIDSSLVVAKMAEQSPGTIRTYSVGFQEEDFNELVYSRRVASRFATDHTELILQPENIGTIDNLILEFGEPFADASMIPTYLICKEVVKHEKVVLGGDGGDELFGGYDSYYFAHKYDKVKWLGPLHPVSKFLRAAFPTYRTDFLARLLNQTKLPPHTLLNRNFAFNSEALGALFANDFISSALDHEHRLIWENYAPETSSDLIKVLSASMKTRLLNDYLVKVDRSSMFASLEMRSPFLDKNLAEFAATLKPSQIFHKNEPKAILKKLAQKYFDKSFVFRRKMGFGIPIGQWFRNSLSERLREVLNTKQNLIDLNYNFVQRIVTEHSTGQADHTDRLWVLYVFHIWANSQ